MNLLLYNFSGHCLPVFVSLLGIPEAAAMLNSVAKPSYNNPTVLAQSTVFCNALHKELDPATILAG